MGRRARPFGQHGREPQAAPRLEVRARRPRCGVHDLAPDGPGQVRFFISGGAPLGREIAEFFHAIGVLILRGLRAHRDLRRRDGEPPERDSSAPWGPPIPGIEVKIAADGEILVRGPDIMKGYYNDPEATREALEPDGWFHTGDIGEIDARASCASPTGRRTSSSPRAEEHRAPEPENPFKTSGTSARPVHGDRKKYLTALLTLDREEIVAWGPASAACRETYAGSRHTSRRRVSTPRRSNGEREPPGTRGSSAWPWWTTTAPRRPASPRRR